jgi:glutamyl-tRNA synthetase
VGDPPSAGEEHLITAAAPLIQPRISRLTQAADMLGFLFTAEEDFAVDPKDAEQMLGPQSLQTLQAAEAALKDVGTWQAAVIEEALRGALIDGLGLKPRQAFGPVRVAVTGHRVSPPLFESIGLLGRERALARLAQALGALPG